MKAIRIVLVDDHPAFLRAAEELLSSEPDLQVVGRARSGMEALEEVCRRKPDLVLLDWNSREPGGPQVLPQIQKCGDRPRVLLLHSLHDLPHYRDAARDLGADGFLCKMDLVERLVPLIRTLFPRPPFGGPEPLPGPR